MPEKIGAGGKPENYDPETGQYTESGGSKSSTYNIYFTDGGYEITKPGESPFHYVIHKYPDIEINKQNVLDIFNKDFKYDRDLLMELSQLVNNSSDTRVGRALLNLFHDDYLKAKKEKFDKSIEPLIQEADEYLVTKPKIEPKNIELASKGANPGYREIYDKYVDEQNYWKHSMSKEEINDFETYTSNCQRCVVAWLLRYQGYDVKAKAYDNNGSDSILSKAKVPIKSKSGWTDYNTWSLSAFNIPPGTTWDYHGADGERAATQLKEMSDIVTKAPNGSTFFCGVHWRGSRNAHVFIAHNNNGKAEFIDPQDNSDATRYFDRKIKNKYGKSQYKIQVGDTRLIRVDNLTLNGKVLKEVVE